MVGMPIISTALKPEEVVQESRSPGVQGQPEQCSETILKKKEKKEEEKLGVVMNIFILRRKKQVNLLSSRKGKTGSI